MLAIALRVLIVVELSLYSALALNFFGLTPLAAAAFALAGLFALRIGITLPPCIYAWFVLSPQPRPGAAQAVRMYLCEFLAFMMNFVVVSPFERWWMGPDRLHPTPGRPPVLLIHGYACSRAAWWRTRRRLENAGWTVATLNLEPIYTSIDNYVEPVARRVDEVLAATGAERLIMVGHSMGGLVARAYLRLHGGSKVARLVTLGTPHGGSELARVGFGGNARQMEPGNPWLTALAGTEVPVDTLTIFSPYDNYVMPPSNLLLPGAQARVIDGVCHLSMLYSPRVVDALLEALQSPLRSPAVASRSDWQGVPS
jgi:triacylglycerol lipase